MCSSSRPKKADSAASSRVLLMLIIFLSFLGSCCLRQVEIQDREGRRGGSPARGGGLPARLRADVQRVGGVRVLAELPLGAGARGVTDEDRITRRHVLLHQHHHPPLAEQV